MVDFPSLGLELLGQCGGLEWVDLSSPGAWTRLSSPRAQTSPCWSLGAPPNCGGGLIRHDLVRVSLELASVQILPNLHPRYSLGTTSSLHKFSLYLAIKVFHVCHLHLDLKLLRLELLLESA